MLCLLALRLESVGSAVSAFQFDVHSYMRLGLWYCCGPAGHGETFSPGFTIC